MVWRRRSSDYDPRSQSEDLGNDAILASQYGIKNLKRIVPQLIYWTNEKGKDYTELSKMYKEAVGQYTRYMGHVLKTLGGIEVTEKTYDQSGAIYHPVSYERQKLAISFFNKELFLTPKWLLDTTILSRIFNGYSGNPVEHLQQEFLASVTSQSRLYRMMLHEREYGKGNYSPKLWLDDLKNGLFSELMSGKKIDSYRRALQKMYVGSIITMYNKRFALQGSLDNLLASVTPPDVMYSNIRPLAFDHLKSLSKTIISGLQKVKDSDSKQHLLYLKQMIDKILQESPIPGLNY